MAKNFIFGESRRKYEESRKRAAETRRKNAEKNRNPEIEELKDFLRGLIPKVNSAARRLQNYYAATGHYSPALEHLEESGGLLRMKQTKNELLNEIMRGQMFLEDPTHTVSGAKDFFSRICTVEEMWRIWDRLKDLFPDIVQRGLVSEVIRELKYQQAQERKTMEELFEYMLAFVQELLREAKEAQSKMWGFE